MSRIADFLRELILAEGPIPLERFMGLANGHPTLGYYAVRDPLGAAGDFTTAPEVSQMFGELIGLWVLEAWRAAGAPTPVHLVELGPGRGTMMADMLRAMRIAPDFLAACTVHLVEASPALKERQRETLGSSGTVPVWHLTTATLPTGPAFIVANEFFDALPVRQYVRAADGWHERLVGLDADGAFRWGAAPAPEPELHTPAETGAVLEVGAVSLRAMTSLSERIAREGGALLAIDYGHTETSLGETLQAVRRHRFVDPLTAPGDADLTAHVDFAALARAARAAGAIVQGPVTQRFFLEQIGIRQRAATLSKRATPADAQKIATGLNRLTATDTPTSMGALFKVLTSVAPGTPALAGFVTQEQG